MDLLGWVGLNNKITIEREKKWKFGKKIFGSSKSIDCGHFPIQCMWQTIQSVADFQSQSGLKLFEISSIK